MSLLALASIFYGISSAASITTADYNIQRTRANTSETLLTQANVTSSFHRKCVHSVDGYVYAQPLIIDSTLIGGVTTILVVATMNNSVYAFNANACTAALWSVNFGSTFAGNPSDTDLYGLQVGILGTPVIDPGNNVIYFTSVNSSGVWKLYAINLVDGTTFHAATTISATVNSVTFSSSIQSQRPGLALANGKIYISFGSYGDLDAYRGWVLAYDETTLAQSNAWLSTRTGTKGALWMAGQAPAIDGSGNLVVAVANGTYNGTNDFGNSFVQLSSTLAVLDWQTPANQAAIDSADMDNGMRVLLTGSFVMGAGKDNRWWVLNAGAMGRLQGGGGNPAVAQVFTLTSAIAACTNGSNNTPCLYDGSTFANNVLYAGPIDTKIGAYSFNGSTFTTTPAAQSTAVFAYPGAMLGYSSNGSTANTEIVWAVTVSVSAEDDPTAGALRAFNAATLAEIFNSDTAGAGADALGNLVKFNPPVVVNGRVYVGTSNAVVTYGLPDSSYPGGASAESGSKASGGPRRRQ